MKSAIEILRTELMLNSKYKETLSGNASQTIGISKFDELINQAKEMEKQQIETAFEEGMFHRTSGLRPDEYYEENFKSE